MFSIEIKKHPNFVEERRLGRLEIDTSLIDNSPSEVLECMRHVLVVRAEVIFSKRCIEYLAYSPLFDKHPDGVHPPLYHFEVEVREGTTKRVEAKRCEFDSPAMERARIIRIRGEKDGRVQFDREE